MLVNLTVIGILSVGLSVCVLLSDPVGTVLYAAYAGVGSYLAIRRPGNVIGWLLIVTGWGLGVGTVRIDIDPDDIATGLDLRQVATALMLMPTINATPIGGQPIDIPNPLTLGPEASFWAIIPPNPILFGALLAILLGGVAFLVARHEVLARAETALRPTVSGMWLRGNRGSS
jgi:hypothetical protein